MTNIDRLHNSILDWDYTFSNRRTGKTRILLHQIIGEIQLGLSEYILLEIPFHSCVSWVKAKFKNALIEQRITISREKRDAFELINENYKLIRLNFIAKGQRKWYGKSAAYYVLDY